MLNMGVLGNSFYSFQKNNSHGTQFIWVQSDHFSSFINLPLSYTSFWKYAIGHFQMLVRPYHSDILDISRLYNLHQLTPKLMNSKWGPIKDCHWHFCAPFAGDFSSHPVLVMWPNGVNPAFANKKVLRLWKCWWTISYRYHSLSCLSFTHQAFTRISRGHSSSGFLEARWSRIKIWVNRHMVFNMKSGESRKSKSMNHHIISVVILNPMTNNIPQTVTFWLPWPHCTKMEHPEMKVASSGTKHCCLGVWGAVTGSVASSLTQHQTQMLSCDKPCLPTIIALDPNHSSPKDTHTHRTCIPSVLTVAMSGAWSSVYKFAIL